MNILITGGNGYIGSHIIVELLKQDVNIIVVDNLSHSDISIPNRIYKITNKCVTFYNMNLNSELLRTIFEKHHITHVIHLAGLKSVEESTKNPLLYYEENVNSTIHLLKVMKEFHVNHIIFSSSATVYQSSLSLLNEQSTLAPSNPYGHTKLTIELLLYDMCKDPDFNCTILRYFNPIGNHSSGLLMDFKSQNIMPKIVESMTNKTVFHIYGQYEYGSAIRDYIHVVDLAKGHIAVLGKKGYHVYNLGTGKGTSVLELIKMMEKVSDLSIPYIYKDKRDGDVEHSVCDPSKIKHELGWETTLTLEEMCRDVMTGVKLNL